MRYQVLNQSPLTLIRPALGCLLTIFSTAGHSSKSLGPISLSTPPNYIDFRGVGDSALSGNKSRTPPNGLGFATSLQRFDPNRRILVGDLNFVNIESQIGPGCRNYYPVDFGFVSDQNMVISAIKHGFQLLGMANNHSEDCKLSSAGHSGATETVLRLRDLGKRFKFQWHGVGRDQDLTRPSVSSYQIKGRHLSVALSAIAFQSWGCEESACNKMLTGTNVKAGQIAAMANTNADLKVMSIHTQGYESSAYDQATQFFRRAGGDIVFGHGPHIWRGVSINKHPTNGCSIHFKSLGNFIHPQLSPQSRNYVGRVIYDKISLKPVQVQVIPISTSGASAQINRSGSLPPLTAAGINWQRGSVDGVPVGYANVASLCQ